MQAGIQKVRSFRKQQRDSYFFNWSIDIPLAFQQPFVPTHEAMAALDLHHGRPAPELAADLRRAFSGIVAGNVKTDGIREIEKHGSFEIHGEASIMGPMDDLLASFVAQHRMKLAGKKYNPCYTLVSR